MKYANQTTISRKNFMTAQEIQDTIGCGETVAYRYIKLANKELEDAGYFTVPGRMPRAYFFKKFGYLQETAKEAD